MEETSTERNVGQVLKSVSVELADLNRGAVDWAAWDDTYAFVEDENEAYRKSNLVDSTFTNQELNLIMLIHASGRVVFARSFDLTLESEAPVPPTIYEHLLPESPLFKHRPDPESSVTGILLLPQGPMLIASRPILTSHYQGPVRGSLIMGRYLDDALVGKLAGYTQVSVALHRCDDPEIPPDVRSAMSSLTGGRTVLTRPLSEELIAGYSLINDIYGRPALLLRVDTPREVYLQGKAGLRYFVLIVMGVMLVGCLIFIFLSEKVVLSRLARLRMDVGKIGSTGDLSFRVADTGNDEITDLAGAINNTLNVLEDSQNKLRESEALFKTLCTGSPTGIYIVQEGKLRFVNLLFEQLSGYTQDELVGVDSLELVVAEDQGLVRDNAIAMLKGNRATPYEFRITTKSGETKWVMGTLSSIQYSGKRAALGNCIDITEYKRVEEALRASEALYRTIFENTGTALTIIEEDTTLSLINTESEKLLGYAKEEIEGKRSWTEFVAAEDLEKMKAYHNLRRTIPDAAPSNYECRLVDKQGKVKKVELTIAMIPGTRKSVASLIDTTERELAEEALRTNEARLRQITDNMMDIISQTDTNGILRYVSPSHTKVLGYQAEEIIGTPNHELVHPEDVPSVTEISRKMYSDAAPALFELRVRHKDGHYVLLETVGNVVRDDNGDIKGSIYCARDNTERKEMDQQLRNAKALLEGVLDAIPDAVGIQDPEHRIIRLNEAGCRLLKMTAEEAKGKRCYELIGRDSRCRPCATERAWRSKKLERVEKYVPELGLYLDCRSNPILDEKGDIRMVVEQFYDVTERRRVEEELVEAKALLEGVLDAIPDAVGIQDPEHRIIRLNQAGYRLLNLTPEQIKGKRCYELIGRTTRCRPCATERAWRTKHLERVEKYVPELGLYLDCRSNPVLNEQGEIQMVVEQFYDVTERRRMEEQLRHLTLHDSLTGLYNRMYFEEEMQRLEGGRYAPVGVIVGDVDGLKLINDTLGHDAGDRLLEAAANVVRKTFRPEDMVARIGGDEFAVLLPKSDRNAVENACKRIRKAVDNYNKEHADIPLSISVGYAVSGETCKDMDELFKEADNNMYREKLHSSQSARSVIVQTLMHTLEARDFITEGHVERLQNLVVRLAGAVGLPENRISDLRLLALFHDIGKVGISDRILLKPGPLSPEERAEMQRHCEIGHRIAQSIPDLPPIANWILKHHEWWNGKGYPLGIEGEEIPLECRILAIADAYDAMTNDRPYRKAISRDEALSELEKCAGTQFDGELVKKFIELIRNEE